MPRTRSLLAAAAALALAAGATQAEAALLATYAASVVVMKRGTATVDADELVTAIETHPVPRISGPARSARFR